MSEIHIPPVPALDPVDLVNESLVTVRSLNHYFGQGEHRAQALFNNNLALPQGQMTITELNRYRGNLLRAASSSQ
jgi:hypothetical protein